MSKTIQYFQLAHIQPVHRDICTTNIHYSITIFASLFIIITYISLLIY